MRTSLGRAGQRARCRCWGGSGGSSLPSTTLSCLRSGEFLGDLMAELEGLLDSSALPPAERLRVLLTVAEILKGQARARERGDALASPSTCARATGALPRRARH